MRYTAPDGRSHDIDPRFGHALAALGWKADEDNTQAEQEVKKTTGRRTTKATDDK